MPWERHGFRALFRFEIFKLNVELLSDNPLFFIINSYTTGLSDVVTRNMLAQCLPKGKIESGTLVLPQKGSDILLPCGTTSRWQP